MSEQNSSASNNPALDESDSPEHGNDRNPPHPADVVSGVHGLVLDALPDDASASTGSDEYMTVSTNDDQASSGHGSFQSLSMLEADPELQLEIPSSIGEEASDFLEQEADEFAEEDFGDFADFGAVDNADVGEEEGTDVGEEEAADVGEEEAADVGEEEAADVGEEEVDVVGEGALPLPPVVHSDEEHSSSTDEEAEPPLDNLEQMLIEYYEGEEFPLSDHSSDEQAEETADRVAFDQNAPSLHQYLGEDLEDVPGRIIYEEGSIVTIPAYIQQEMVLMPGQTMPLTVSNDAETAVLRTAVNQKSAVALLSHMSMRHYELNQRKRLAQIGTTAEVLSMSSERNDMGVIHNNVRAITKGRQRFRLLNLKRSGDSMLRARIYIQPEPKYGDALEGAIPPSHYRPRARYHQVVRAEGAQAPARHRKVHNQCSYFTPVPGFVYSQFSEVELMDRLREEMKQWGDRTYNIMVKIRCPDELSYWLAYNIPMSSSNKLVILALTSYIQRLRHELNLLQTYDCLSCRRCNTQIAKKSDVFSLSWEGPMGTYVNPHGCVHETITVHKIKNLSTRGRPTTEFSWFPGYAWMIVNCRSCGDHKGWKYSSDELKPSVFYGLTRSGLIPGKFSGGAEDSEQTDHPFFL